MGIAIDTTEHVDADPEVVWRRLTDWKAAGDWMGVEALEAAGPSEPGAELRFRARGGSHTSQITELLPGRRITLRSSQGPVTADYTYTCEPAGRGTRLSLVAECRIRGPLALLGPLLRLAVRRSDGGQLRALKGLCESEGFPGADRSSEGGQRDRR